MASARSSTPSLSMTADTLLATVLTDTYSRSAIVLWRTAAREGASEMGKSDRNITPYVATRVQTAALGE